MPEIEPPIVDIEPKLDRIEELTRGLCKVRSRLVRDMVTGIIRSNSMRLTHIADSLNESISLHATHKRLSRNLGDTALGQHLQKRILELGAAQVSRDTRIMLDRFDIKKRYARKMEFIEEFESGDDESSSGYHGCEVIASDLVNYWPIDISVWSRKVPNHKGEQACILELVRRTREATGPNGILVVNARLGDVDELLTPWTMDPSSRYVIRLHSSRELIYQGRRLSAGHIFNDCERPYGKLLFNYDTFKEQQFFLDFGCVPVRLPGAEERPLWLVCAKVDTGMHYHVLTTEAEVEQREGLEKLVRAYITRQQVSSTMRIARKKLDFDDMRVHSFRRLENLLRLYQSAAYSAYSTSRIKMIDAGITYDRHVSVRSPKPLPTQPGTMREYRMRRPLSSSTT